MYYFLFGIFYFLSLWPLRCLYLLSYFFRWVIFDLIKYRHAVIWSNLRNSFPEKNDQELQRIYKDFQLAFCDQWIEVVKLISMPESSMNAMVQADWNELNKWHESGRNVHVFLGHQFNWELANLVCQSNTIQPFYGIYLPLTSRPFDRLMSYIRTRTGSKLVNAQDLFKDFKQLRHTQHILGVIADQSSGHLDSSYWYNFFNRPCPFNIVPEKTARVMDSVVIFASMHKVKRGLYRLRFELITEDASITQKGEIMDRYVALLESDIRQQPHNWLWSHKRWKRAKPDHIDTRQ